MTEQALLTKGHERLRSAFSAGLGHWREDLDLSAGERVPGRVTSPCRESHLLARTWTSGWKLKVEPWNLALSCQNREFALLEVYRNIMTWYQEQESDTEKFATNQALPPTSLFYKRALLRAFGEFGGFNTWAASLLAWPCNKTFSAPNSDILVLLDHTVHQANGHAFNTTCSPKYSAGAWGPLRAELKARLTTPPGAGLKGWWKWAGRSEGPSKAMFWPGHPSGIAPAWTFWGAFMGCLRLLLFREERGASGCCSHAHGPAPQGTDSLCFHVWSMWAPNRFPHLEPRAGSQRPGTWNWSQNVSYVPPHVLQCLLHTFVQTSLGRRSSVPLTPSQPLLPRGFNQPFHSFLETSAVMAITCPTFRIWVHSLSILRQFLENSHPAQTSPGQGVRHWVVKPFSVRPHVLWALRAGPHSAQWADDAIPRWPMCQVRPLCLRKRNWVWLSEHRRACTGGMQARSENGQKPQTRTVQEGEEAGQVPLQEVTVCPRGPCQQGLRSKHSEFQCHVPTTQNNLGQRTVFLDQ